MAEDKKAEEAKKASVKNVTIILGCRYGDKIPGEPVKVSKQEADHLVGEGLATKG